MGSIDSCAVISSQLNESMAGTALLTQRWVLLEVAAPWAAKPLQTPGIPPAVREYLAGVLSAAPHSRLQLIGRAGVRTGCVRLMVVRSGCGSSHVHSWSLPSLEHVCDVDIAEAWEQAGTSEQEPFVLVCTHGRRDRCCSRAGYPMFRALSKLRPESVWQTTHLGGHRFAATAVVLPLGVQYGRLVGEDAKRLIASLDTATVMDLERYRGRIGLTQSAQAAEIAIRRDTGEMRVSKLQHVHSIQSDDAVWEEHFDLDGVIHTREVIGQVQLESRPFSCGDPPNRRPSAQCVLSTTRH